MNKVLNGNSTQAMISGNIPNIHPRNPTIAPQFVQDPLPKSMDLCCIYMG